IMCSESVVAVLASAILISERLNGKEILGCSIMFAAILASNIGDIVRKRRQEKISSDPRPLK
ncbi:MAG: hypothetical protein K5839_02815, partial [Treponemataceae bacterium]|nr:hypothetical protein [Treponemataceae bacterium]